MVAASYYPRRVNMRVPNMQYAAEINLGAPYVCNFGVPLALDTDGLVAAITMVNGSASRRSGRPALKAPASSHARAMRPSISAGR